ncbi:MAG: DHH family phosphoesterase [Methanomicrobiaceae archaeon]|nr:DHH family phosphoesterase [Methanomicrobiaceae archaeon]
MSLSSAAEHLGERLRACGHVRIFTHDDADGIAGAAILCQALARAGIGFHVSVRDRIVSEDVRGEENVLLCDLGAAHEDLPEETMVIDHHLPFFTGPWHVNPRLEEEDGETSCSAAGMAYCVAQELGDNRDLAGLAITGMIGDRQTCTGTNRDICNDGMAAGTIVPRRGLRLPGRNPAEQLVLAVDPYIEGISGEEASVSSLLAECTPEKSPDSECLISRLVLEMAPTAPAEAMEALYGDRYELGREIIHDAHALAAVLDACGKSGKGGLGISLCLRSTAGIEEAWEIARAYRLTVIGGIRSALRVSDTAPFFETENPGITGAVADAIAYSRMHTAPVVVMARSEDAFTVSARCPAGINTDLGSLLHRIARECGGEGGGHGTRAGARVPAEQIDRFKNGILEALAS